jgi:hypothetical protein
VVERSIASQNGYTGVLTSNSLIAHSQSSENRAAGLVIQGLGGSLAVGNVVHDNVGYGITATSSSGYVNNVVNRNNGGNNNAQIASGNSLGTNVCAGNTSCP